MDNSSPGDNKFSNYFNKRVESFTTNLIKNNDDSNIDELSTILSMPNKTKEEKKNLFKAFLEKQDGADKLDPILAFKEDSQDFDKVEVHGKFLENVLNQKKDSSDICCTKSCDPTDWCTSNGFTRTIQQNE